MDDITRNYDDLDTDHDDLNTSNTAITELTSEQKKTVKKVIVIPTELHKDVHKASTTNNKFANERRKTVNSLINEYYNRDSEELLKILGLCGLNDINLEHCITQAENGDFSFIEFLLEKEKGKLIQLLSEREKSEPEEKALIENEIMLRINIFDDTLKILNGALIPFSINEKNKEEYLKIIQFLSNFYNELANSLKDFENRKKLDVSRLITSIGHFSINILEKDTKQGIFKQRDSISDLIKSCALKLGIRQIVKPILAKINILSHLKLHNNDIRNDKIDENEQNKLDEDIWEFIRQNSYIYQTYNGDINFLKNGGEISNEKDSQLKNSSYQNIFSSLTDSIIGDLDNFLTPPIDKLNLLYYLEKIQHLGTKYGLSKENNEKFKEILEKSNKNGVSNVALRGLISNTINKIYDLEEKNEKLTIESNSHPLTKLLNASALKQYVETILSKQKRELKEGNNIKDSHAFIFIDINFFKTVNDELGGHLVGDRNLIHITSILKESCRKEDIIFHIGGDEFVIIANIKEDFQKEVKEIKNRIIINFEKKPFKVEGKNLFIINSYSGGTKIIKYKENGGSIEKQGENVKSEADEGLYWAKRGRGVIEKYIEDDKNMVRLGGSRYTLLYDNNELNKTYNKDGLVTEL